MFFNGSIPKNISSKFFYSFQAPISNILYKISKLENEPAKLRNERQCKDFNRLFNYAIKNVPYYSLKYRNKNITINSLGSLNIIDPINKSDIRTNKELFLSREFSKSNLKKVITSGSTGEPLELYVNNEFFYWKQALLHRHYKQMGYNIGDKIAVLWGSRSYFKFKRFRDELDNIFLNTREYRAYKLTEIDMYNYAKFLAKYKPDFIETYPSAINLLGNVAEKYGLKIKPKAIQVTSEMLLPTQREYIEDIFNTRVFNKYGANEVGPIAQECVYHDGFHINDEALIVEINEKKEILLTSLINYTMPLIRYKIGDLGELTIEECSCGLKSSKIRNILGRINDMIVVSDGSLVDPYFFINLMCNLKNIKKFKVIQYDYNKLKIIIVPDIGFNEEISENLIYSHIGELAEGMNVKFNYTDDIPSEQSGKYIHVTSKLKGGTRCL